MEIDDLLKLTVEKIKKLGVRYFVTGSTATTMFGEPRFTNDIDLAYIDEWTQKLHLSDEWSEIQRRLKP